ncbi:topoisomerase DNA-binding C4 zinc finger domain-containing protein [Francisella sp. 19X1-34]|uniref:topoisomerase DNA-binding C4 zinc finger domain-containing protein n=1 Tax=Francisella sp. 19X1-34 TaxID=3087177 RepID=UPI002E370DCF|nr:topoisomerase DNA-binding C4 zinc finger domain-containing protein [Francisella sp. 19X1-34]MED7789638.1 topoisomerase DNA-binding C4 zinc finger domain-containing protein [Francisella sp. 19X1-34]
MSKEGNDINYECPDCGSDLIQRDGKKGKWWGCTGYPQCERTFTDSKDKPMIGH